MQNVHAMREEVRADYEAALGVVSGDGAFGVRFERFFADLRDPLVALYGADPRWEAAWRRLLGAIAETAASRSAELRLLDHEREITPDWLQREQAVGYVTYVDRFAGDLAGVRARLPYLRELGVTYLHLMPLLRARPAPNDGGYAVVDYGAVEPSLGSLDDLRELASDLREAGMALCIDVVLNHTAAEHPWTAEESFYRTFPDRSQPDAFERTLPEVFPDTAPGSFTWVEDRWVWTTFNAYQWDLDYTNPSVFVAMAEAMLFLASVGVDVLRLDAAPFLWKRLGTNCQNQPEVHELLQAFRAVMRIAAPAVAFKAEAIVAPVDLVPYLGTGRHEGKECDLAYHNVLMVLLWSSLASGRVALMTRTLLEMPAVPPGAGWLTYVRCHDDIGWAITPEDAGRVGEDAYLHRRFLADWYAGEFPGTFARGARFQFEPHTGEARTSGTCASLGGARVGGRRGRRRARDPARAAAVRARVRARRAAVDLHGRRARALERCVLSRRTRRGATTTAGCTGRRWTGRRPRGATTRRRSRAGCGPGCSGWSRSGARRPRSTSKAPSSRSGPATTTSSGSCARRPASRCSCWRTSPPTRSPSVWACSGTAGSRCRTRPPTPDGRSLEAYEDVVVLAPYQHLWFPGDSQDGARS